MSSNDMSLEHHVSGARRPVYKHYFDKHDDGQDDD